MRQSISQRLALMLTACGCVIFLLFSMLLHSFLLRVMERQERSELATRLEVHEVQIERINDTTRWNNFRIKLENIEPENGRVRYWVLSDDERYRYGAWPAGNTLPSVDAKGYGELTLPNDALPRKLLMRHYAGSGDRPEVHVIVAIDRKLYQATLRSFTLALVGLSALGIVLVATLSYVISRIGLKPLRRLSSDAERLSPSKLSQRLGTEGLPSELEGLATAFNGGLDRLESAYQQLEAFNADVAHDLRTPLTNLIGQTQVALSRERSADELLDTLESNLEELDRLRTIVNDMLFLARADRGETARDRVEVSLAQEVAKTLDYLDFVLEDSGVHVTIRGDARIAAETSLLGRAMTNLLVNAVQHSEHGADIVVDIRPDGGDARIAVANPGPQIPLDHLERLFDRFYRVDSARSGSHDNHGLGLAIVKAIAHMHGGSVFASSASGINTFGLTLAATR